MRSFIWVRIGCSWRYLPSHIPPWQMVYYHFRQFSRTGLGIHLYRELHFACCLLVLGEVANSLKHAQVRRALAFERRQSMASSLLREYRNVMAKTANFLPKADASTHRSAHQGSVLRYWPQVPSPETDSPPAPRAPKNRNRVSRSFPTQALYWLCSKAASR